MNIGCYIITCDGREALLEETLRQFSLSDWGVEPTIIRNRPNEKPGWQGTAANSLRAINRAIEDGVDYMWFAEDDITPNRHIRHNLENWWPIRGKWLQFGNLYLPDMIVEPWEREHESAAYRIPKIRPGSFPATRLWGSQAYIFHKDFLTVLSKNWRRKQGGQDSRAMQIATENGVVCVYHLPSIVEHRPGQSVFGSPYHYAIDFDGDWKNSGGFGPGFVPHDPVAGWLTYGEGQLLYKVAEKRRVLELGTQGGRATVCLAQSARKVVTIDSKITDEAKEWFRRYGLSSKIIPIDAEGSHPTEAVRDFACEFDLVLVDTEHDAASVRRDIDVAIKVLKPGGLIAFHDYPAYYWPEVRPVVDEYARKLGWKRTHQIDYMGVFRTPE